MKYLLKCADYLIKAIEVVCFALMALMTLATFAQAVNRYIFNSSFFWAEEAAIMSMIYIAFLGATLAVRRDSHTRIDFLINRLPAKTKRYVDALNNVVCALFMGFLAKSALPIINVTSTQKTIGMGAPRSLYYYAILISSILMIVYLLILALFKIVGYEPDKANNEELAI
jgi:TRAP-type C4-dicarboxylate transport system permease small subunit